MSNLISGTNIISDNWQFMVVSNFLAGKVDPNEVWGWIASTEKNTLYGEIQAGVFQLDCLINLLEQIVFTNSISLMKQWIPSWVNDNTSLNKLFDEENGSFIQALDITQYNIQKEKQKYLDQLLWNETIKNKFQKGMEEFQERDFKGGKYLFWSQVINGIAEYLALADKLNLTYSPHSVRAGFLKSNLWNINPSPTISYGVNKFHKVLNVSRTKIIELYGYNSILSKLTLSIPSTAILCIAESSNSISVIDVALQLRNNSGIKALRQILHELTLAINREFPDVSSLKKIKEIVYLLEYTIKEVEKKLLMDTKLIKKNEVPSKIDVEYFNYKKNVISTYNDIKHSGIISKLLLSSGTRTNEIISSKLKINNEKIFKQFLSWHSDNFFNDISSKKIINFNIIMEENYNNFGNAGIVGPGGKIINFEQNSFIEKKTDVDLKILLTELQDLLSKLKESANSPEKDAQCALIAEAIEKAKQGDNKAVNILKKASKWVFETATNIGIKLITEILKEKFG